MAYSTGITSGLAALLLVAMTCTHAGEVYKWVDKNGVTHFGDSPPAAQAFSVPEIRLDAGSEDATSDPDPDPIADNRVVMYGTSWCTYCKAAKAYFRKKRIRFVEYDIEASATARRRYDKLGGRGVPLIVVGDRQMTGFTPESFERLYHHG